MRERTCIGCRARRHPDEMLRVTYGDRGLVLGPHGQGRGAWLCPTEECLRAAEKRRALPRALRTDVPREAYDVLREAIVTGVLSLERSFVKR